MANTKDKAKAIIKQFNDNIYNVQEAKDGIFDNLINVNDAKIGTFLVSKTLTTVYKKIKKDTYLKFSHSMGEMKKYDNGKVLMMYIVSKQDAHDIIKENVSIDEYDLIKKYLD